MEKKSMKKKVTRIVLFAICFAMAASTMTFADVAGTGGKTEKNETVYVILDHDGKVLDERVVNRIHASGKVEEVLDFGEYSSVRNMKSDAKPEISGNEIKWDGRLLEKGDIYYEGVTDKELPVEAAIEYYLDGARISAAELAGKTGDLKIVIKLKNRLKVTDPIMYESRSKGKVSKSDEYYVPLLVQVSYAADLDTFSDIKAGDAIKVVTGKTMNLGFAAFPYPDAEITFEMYGDNIELNPINFTVVPQMPSTIDVDMEEDMEKLLDGVVQIRTALDRFKSAITPLASGNGEFESRGREFQEGISRLSEGSKQLDNNSAPLISGFDSSMQAFTQLKDGVYTLFGGLKQAAAGTETLAGAAKTISSSVISLEEGAGRLGEAGTKLAEGLNALQNMNSNLVRQAQLLMAQNPQGSELYNLGAAILAQNEAVKALASAGSELENGAKALGAGLGSLRENLDNSFVPGVEQLNSALKALETGSGNLLEGMAEYEKGQKAYREGLASYTSGVGEMARGLKTLDENASGMFESLGGLFEAQKYLGGGMDKIDTSGISEMEKGLMDAIDEIRFGKAKKEKMKELAEGYRSFMDNSKNRDSSVQFIMQTEKIKAPESAKTSKADKSPAGESFWKKLLKLFGL